MRPLVVIPAFNEAGSIARVLAGVRSNFGGDCVVVDDGSSDETAALARVAGAMVLRHPCNLGIGATVQTGLLFALRQGYDAVVRIDGDGQHDPAYVPQLLSLIANGEADVVIGSRFLAREGYQSTMLRRAGILILGLVSALVGARVTDPTSGYWALNRRAIELLARFQPDDYPETQALLITSRAGCRLRELPVVMQERASGVSSLASAWSAGFYMFKVILAVLIERLRSR